jgi:hypothetical protein
MTRRSRRRQTRLAGRASTDYRSCARCGFDFWRSALDRAARDLEAGSKAATDCLPRYSPLS